MKNWIKAALFSGFMAGSLLFVLACGEDKGPMIATPATPAIEKIDLSGYLFTPNLVTVAAGKTARFELTGDGLEHTFTIQGLAVDIPVPVGTKSQIVEFIVPAGKSGDFPLICSLHELAGMVGTVRVK